MQRSFGPTFKLTLSLSGAGLTLGPGWAALAGALAAGYPALNLTTLLKLLALWFLADPILGTFWELLVRQGVWRRIRKASLPPPPARGFYLPYAQPGSPAGRLVLLLRRYRVWWRESHWPEFSADFVTLGLGLGVALLLSLFLGTLVFAMTVVIILLTWWTGRRPAPLSAAAGGRWQTLVQFFLPWLVGSLLWLPVSLPELLLAFCYGAVYLGGLRMLGEHHHADKLFFLGQAVSILLLFALRLLPGGAIVAVLLIAQWLIRTRFRQPVDFLARVQPYVVTGLLVAGISVGSLS